MKQKTATGAKDPRHLSSIAPTVAHVTDGTKVGSNRPFRASVPDGYNLRGGWLTTPGAYRMAFGAVQRWPVHRLTLDDWGKMLRRMRFAPSRIAQVRDLLHRSYPQPLTFSEWADLFAQLAAEHVLATKYGHPR